MAHPKRKTSKARRDRRRANWKLTSPNTANCSHCGQPKMPHRICPNCGYYRGKQVVTTTD